MSMLVVDRRGAAVALENHAIVVREPDARPRTVPVRGLTHLVVMGAVQVDGRLCARLAAEGATVSFLPGRGPVAGGAVLSAIGYRNVGRRLAQYRLVTNDADACALARDLIRLRLLGMLRVLRRGERQRPDRRRPLFRARGQIAGLLEALEQPESSRATLRGREGAATAAFFEGYRTLFSPALAFRSRNRRPPRDAVNAALSLGYTLLHADALRALQLAGLDPHLGVLHEATWGRESLACDIVELGRCRVEDLIRTLFAEQVLTTRSFAAETNGVRLRKEARSAFFTAWSRGAAVHRHWFRRAARVLVARLDQPGDARA